MEDYGGYLASFFPAWSGVTWAVISFTLIGGEPPTSPKSGMSFQQALAVRMPVSS